MSTKTTIENDEKTTVGDRFCLDYLPGLSKEYYYEFADWKVRKEHLLGMLKHYSHGQLHPFDEGYEVQILFRPLTVRVLQGCNTPIATTGVEQMTYILRDMINTEPREPFEDQLDVKVCFDNAVMVEPNWNFDTYYYERRQGSGQFLSDEHGPLNPHESSNRACGIPASAVEVV